MDDAKLEEIQARADAVTANAPYHIRNEAKVVLFIHAPADIRTLLEEVRRGKAVEELSRNLYALLVEGCSSYTIDSAYRAGATFGWNAAQDGESGKSAFENMSVSYSGRLKGFQKWADRKKKLFAYAAKLLGEE